MKFIVAPDSFKGSLSSACIIDRIKKAGYKIFPDCEMIGVPIADGGEGTLEAIISYAHGEYQQVAVKNTLGMEIQAKYGVLNQEVAIIEMAEASGLTLISEDVRNPLNTTTYGTGQLIEHALSKGYKKIVIAIGGSGTNDGGIGAMAALGVRFLDKDGVIVEPVGKSLIKIADIDITNLHPKLTKADITVMCDVNNPLLGPMGATYVYGPQKGGSSDILEQLEQGMENYVAVIKELFQIDISNKKGAGAAGGLGAALMFFTGAKLQSGISTLLKLIRFEELLEGADLVITGEGRIDEQSAYGKVPSGIGQLCKEKGVPVIAIVGGIGKGANTIYDYGVDSILSIVNAPMSLSDAMEHGEELLEDAAERLFRVLRVGTMLKKA